MKHAAEAAFGLFLADNAHRVFHGVAAVDHNGHLQFPRQTELTAKDIPLNIVVDIILKMVVETDLTDGHHFFLRRPAAELFFHGFVVLIGVGGVDPHHGVDRLILFRHFHGHGRHPRITADDIDLRHSRIEGPMKRRFGVFGKSFVIEMGMGIVKHQLTVPPPVMVSIVMSSSASSFFAQRSIPQLSMPRSFTGLRFATTTTFFPIRSSGA